MAFYTFDGSFISRNCRGFSGDFGIHRHSTLIVLYVMNDDDDDDDDDDVLRPTSHQNKCLIRPQKLKFN